MKNLYFMFAVLTLPIMAFAEGSSMNSQTTLKEGVHENTRTPDSQKDDRCASNDEKCVQNSRHRFNEMKSHESHEQHNDKASAAPASQEG